MDGWGSGARGASEAFDASAGREVQVPVGIRSARRCPPGGQARPARSRIRAHVLPAGAHTAEHHPRAQWPAANATESAIRCTVGTGTSPSTVTRSPSRVSLTKLSAPRTPAPWGIGTGPRWT